MDNPTRSERTRTAAINAALVILDRDGPGGLTFDSLSRESGISKGGLLHQFKNKSAILEALLEHQMAHFSQVSEGLMAEFSQTRPAPVLATQLAVLREASRQPNSVALALIAALVENPALLQINRDIAAKSIADITAEAADPEMAMMRWAAARGLLLSGLFGLCPFTDKERDRMFERLLDDDRWPAAIPATDKPVKTARMASKRR